MKKVTKTPGPNALTQYAARHSVGEWEEGFRRQNQGQSYHLIRDLVFADQGGLCAYCESHVASRPEHERRIEHYHDKSDRQSVRIHNWGLDWNNILGVCVGGSDDESKRQYQLPTNLSCDSHKAHLKSEIDAAPEGRLLNPLQLPATPCLFALDKRTGKLTADVTHCGEVTIDGNQFATTQELVEETIRILNLNCDRLNQQRLAVLYEYNRLIGDARRNNNPQIFNQLAQRWLQKGWVPWFSTRRILLGQHAESWLMANNYQG